MAANALVQTRIDADVKERAAAILEEQGMTVSEAVRILLTRTANEGALPFAPLNAKGQAEYDAWFRAKVQEALDNPGPGASNEEAKAHFATRIAELRKEKDCMKLRWTDLAMADRKMIFEYIAVDNLDVAATMEARIASEADLLIDFPELGRTGVVGEPVS